MAKNKTKATARRDWKQERLTMAAAWYSRCLLEVANASEAVVTRSLSNDPLILKLRQAVMELAQAEGALAHLEETA